MTREAAAHHDIVIIENSGVEDVPDFRQKMLKVAVHVLKPLPRKLLEHGGSENPVTEGQLQSQLKQDQAEWYRTQAEAECPYLLRARDLLIKAGLRSEGIELKFGHEEDIARNILEEARSGGYRTIVLGRYGTSSMMRFCPSVASEILRTMATRVRNLEGFSQQREKFVSLGTMAAGLAHASTLPALQIEPDVARRDDREQGGRKNESAPDRSFPKRNESDSIYR